VKVLIENRAILHLSEKMRFDIKRRREEGVYGAEVQII